MRTLPSGRPATAGDRRARCGWAIVVHVPSIGSNSRTSSPMTMVRPQSASAARGRRGGGPGSRPAPTNPGERRGEQGRARTRARPTGPVPGRFGTPRTTREEADRDHGRERHRYHDDERNAGRRERAGPPGGPRPGRRGRAAHAAGAADRAPSTTCRRGPAGSSPSSEREPVAAGSGRTGRRRSCGRAPWRASAAIVGLDRGAHRPGARCRRERSVPSGIPSASAASTRVRPR